MDDPVDPRFVEYRRTGERSLRNQLVEEHRGLAGAVAARYRNRGVPSDDLGQVALLGLIAAVERFDPDRGVPFAPWATMVVDGECKSWFRDRTWSVKVGRSTKDLVVRLRRAQDAMEQDLGRSPTVAELADRLGETQDRVIEALEADQSYRPVSLDTPTREGGPSTDPVERRDDLADVDRRTLVEQLLAQLSPDDAAVVRMRFFDDMSQREISERVGVSQMQISRVLRRVLLRLRELASDDG